MRVLVAGATSVLGLPVLSELVSRGHEVFGLTRRRPGAEQIAATGAVPLLGDAYEIGTVRTAMQRSQPEAVLSLLITLPRYGPRRFRDFRPTVRLWRRGVPNLLEAAAEGGVQRVVAESVVFSYGLADYDAEWIDEDFVPDRSVGDAGGAWVLSALHEMERRVLDDSRFAGSVLRYGLFHGSGVPSTQLLLTLMRWRLPAIPGRGRGVASWIDVSDAARAAADAVTEAEGGHLYNVVDDHPVAFVEYAKALERGLGLPRARHLPAWLARVVMPYTALVFDEVRLPVSNTKAKERLGWQPRFPSVDDVARVLAR